MLTAYDLARYCKTARLPIMAIPGTRYPQPEQTSFWAYLPGCFDPRGTTQSALLLKHCEFDPYFLPRPRPFTHHPHRLAQPHLPFDLWRSSYACA